MAAALTIIVSSITLIISAIMILRIYGRNFIVTIPGMFYLSYIILIFVGSPVVFIDSNYSALAYYISTHLGMFLPILGIMFVNHYSQTNTRSALEKFLQKPLVERYGGASFRIPFLILCAVSIAVSYKYLSAIDIPIFYLFGDLDSALSLAKLREMATTTLKGIKLHRYRFFMSQLLPVLSIIAYLKMKMNGRFFWKILFLSLFFATSFMAVVDLQKKPLLAYLLMVFVAMSFYKGRVNYRSIVIITLIILLLLFAMFTFIMGLEGRPFSDVLSAISSRLFIGQSYPLLLYFQAFPQKHDYLYGQSFPNPGGMFPFKPFPLTRYIFNTNLGIADIAATAPTVFFGEIYANFGFAIMMLWMIFVGILLQLIQNYFQNKEKNVILSAFYIFYIIQCMQLALTSFFVVFHLYLILFVAASQFLKLTSKLISGSLRTVHQNG
ncbi:MAG: oligosaccharide repeat unit polymerase [Candidatus Marinimicrobia bacterium]|nr:oligosaccharide repeat unit polymerase [Candidatus Neomarinimicrobiota bacterium]